MQPSASAWAGAAHRLPRIVSHRIFASLFVVLKKSALVAYASAACSFAACSGCSCCVSALSGVCSSGANMVSSWSSDDCSAASCSTDCAADSSLLSSSDSESESDELPLADARSTPLMAVREKMERKETASGGNEGEWRKGCGWLETNRERESQRLDGRGSVRRQHRHVHSRGSIQQLASACARSTTATID